MHLLYLALAIVGTVVPYLAFAPWLAQNGLDVPLLVTQMFATPVSRFFSLDLIISAIVVFVMAARGMQRGVRHAWLALVGTISVGVSLGLPLYLFLEARHDGKISQSVDQPDAPAG
jgi:hypothetical protein